MNPPGPELPLYAPPAPAESIWRRWRHAVVRDLAWAVASPPLLLPSTTGMHWLDAAWGERASAASVDWLAHLDRDPAPLQAQLARRGGRLGAYFENLLALWLAWPGNPLYRLRHHGLAVRTRNRTLGELDFLVEDRASGELQHWEVAVKFYLGVAPGGGHADWIGPGLQDRLDLKVQRLLQHQLTLSRLPETERLLKQLGLPAPAPTCLLHGRFFYPPGVPLGEWAPAAAAPGHLTGWWMPPADFRERYADSPLTWVRLPREHWLAPVDLTRADPAVPIGDPLPTSRFIEAVQAAADNRIMAVVGLLERQEVTRGFVTFPQWPRTMDPA